MNFGEMRLEFSRGVKLEHLTYRSSREGTPTHAARRSVRLSSRRSPQPKVRRRTRARRRRDLISRQPTLEGCSPLQPCISLFLPKNALKFREGRPPCRPIFLFVIGRNGKWDGTEAVPPNTFYESLWSRNAYLTLGQGVRVWEPILIALFRAVRIPGRSA